MMAQKRLLAVALSLSIPLAGVAQDAPKPPPITVTPYGIISLAEFSNSGQFGTKIDYPDYATNKKEGTLASSARQSRLGFNVAVPADNLLGANVTGKVEFDFMGPGATSWNSAPLRLRHAYVNADWAMGPGKLFVLAGQTDGLVNALHPDSSAYLANPLFQQAGNLHRRTPQIRLGYNFDDPSFAVKVEAGVLSPADGVAVDYGAGARSGSPEIEARLGLTMKPISNIGGTIGVGYHTNTRAYDDVGFVAADGAPIEKVTATLMGLDVNLSLTEYLGLSGEYFTGKGIDDEFAGISTTTVGGAAGARKPVETSGYWAQANIKPVPFLSILVGTGNEKVKDATLPTAATAQRLENKMMHGGLLVHMNKAWRVGVEYVGTTTTARANSTSAGVETKASQLSLSTQLRF
jgi:hypothetical protein